MNDSCYFGLDGGGTRTVAILTDPAGETLAFGRGGSTNYHTVGEVEAKKNMFSILNSLLIQPYYPQFNVTTENSTLYLQTNNTYLYKSKITWNAIQLGNTLFIEVTGIRQGRRLVWLEPAQSELPVNFSNDSTYRIILTWDGGGRTYLVSRRNGEYHIEREPGYAQH